MHYYDLILVSSPIVEGAIQDVLLEIIDRPCSNLNQKPLPVEIDDCLSAYMDNISHTLFGEKAIEAAELILEDKTANVSIQNNDENSDKESPNFDPMMDYVPSSPASSEHSVYKPPNFSEDEDYITGN